MELWIALAVVLIVLGWVGWTFNLLVRRRNGTDAAWATVGVELTRRHDLVPMLVAAVRGYAAHEEALFDRVASARAEAIAGADPQVSPGEEARAETALTDALRSLFAVVEGYPELKAAANFAQLQSELETTEDRIAYARGYYNAWVTEYETLRQSIPSVVVARLFGFGSREYFEAEVSERVPVGVELGR